MPTPRGGPRGRSVGTLAGLAALLLAVPIPLQAQQPDLLVSAGISVGHAVGGFADYVSGLRGVEGAIRSRVGLGPVRVRAAFRYMRFPATARVRTWGGGAVGPPVSITTGSRLFVVDVGPEVRIQRRALAVVTHAGVGLVRSFHSSVVRGLDDIDPFDRAVGFGDFTYALGAGAAVQWRVAGRRTPVWIGAAVGCLTTGSVHYVRETNIPVGYISGAYLHPSAGRASLMNVTVTASVPVGPR